MKLHVYNFCAVFLCTATSFEQQHLPFDRLGEIGGPSRSSGKARPC